MSVFIGSGVAIITPFDENGVNLDTFAKLIDFQIENGTDAIIVCGTTGEPSTMTQEEKHAAIEFAVKHVAHRVPVIAGTGGNNTKKAVEDSVYAQKLGVDGLLHVTPYYNKCTQDGAVAHFSAIADAVDLPIIIYNVPGRTGFNLLPATLKRLSAHKNIAGVKEASANIEQITEVARLCPEIDLYSGNDDHVVPLMALGAKGVISVVANVAPRMTHDMVIACLNGDWAKGRELQFKLNPVVKALFNEVNPIPVKSGVGMLGYDVGSVRLPLTPISEPNRNILETEMRKAGLI